MDRNFVLACALSLAVLVGWIYLTGGPEPGQRSTDNSLAQSQAIDSQEEILDETAPSHLVAQPARVAERASATPAPQPDRIEVAERQILVETPLYSVELTNRGAGISSWKLKEFRETSDRAAPLIDLVTGRAVGITSLVTPFSELGIGDFADRVFEVVSEDVLSIAFETRENNVTIRKIFTFEPDSYSFRLLIEVLNDSTAAVAPRFQIDITAHTTDADDFREQALAALEDGSRVNAPLKGLGRTGFFQSITGRSAEQHEDYLGPIDWAGIQTTYFLTAILPDNPSQANVRMATLEPGVSGDTQLSFVETAIPPGRSIAREFRGYMGPKEMERLETFGGETVRAIDLGWSWVEPLTRS
jgi:YidC/Oxa1 family membrane protein insertase